ncbi:MAG: nucleoside hydrolase [Alistipes sp.]|nr:nucleoside hydrolase [Alistipes sp.]
MKRLLFLLLTCLLAPALSLAHSGKARYHIIVDTDGAADDLRALCLLLGNREAEVLAVTASDGAQHPRRTAACVSGLLRTLHHEGIPVGCGRTAGAAAPPWRAHSEQVDWGDTPAAERYPDAPALLAETIDHEEEPIIVVALGALTNFDNLFAARPALKNRIDRIIWYNDASQPLEGANYRTDPAAARNLLASGIPVQMVSACDESPVIIDAAWLDTIATVPSPCARRIVATHRTLPLSRLVEQRHLQAWDDLAALALFMPELFDRRQLTPTVTVCTLRNPATFCGATLALLQGKPDAESRVFYGFPTGRDCYAQDVEPIVGQAVVLHGPSEWRAAVLTNELHGHLGIYATIGVKMGIRAREYFNIGVDDIEVTTYAGHCPPISCMNDGLQVGTGATVGHGLIRVAECSTPRPEALFRFKNKAVRMRLKPEYADRIRRDVQRGIELYGNLTEDYWQYIRQLALQYWLEFDRHEIFEVQAEEVGL